MPFQRTSALLSLALGVVALLFGAQVAEAKAKPCAPIIDTPKSDTSVSTQFKITVRPDMTQNCRVDEIRVEITEIVPGGNNRQAYYSEAECCDFLSIDTPVIDRRVPEGVLEPDTRYSLKVQFLDRTFNILESMDTIRAEYGPLAVVPVRTKPAQRQSGGFDPMIFALDMNGRFGHGRGETVAQAGNTALDYCGAQACRLVSDPVRQRCHALAQRTRGGYWWGVGAGSTATAARSRAQDFCTDAAPGSCETVYTYCQ